MEVFEPRENPYSQQEYIIKRMFSKKHIAEDCFAAAGTQMLLPTSIATERMNVFEEHFSNELLEGEYPWEKRQDKALKLALTGHPLIASN